MTGPDSPTGDDAERLDDEFAEYQHALFDRIESFMDEEEHDDGYMADLLIDAAIRLRMSSYGVEVDKPSVAGLKLDLDRMRTEIEQAIREVKKDAEEYIANIKAIRAEEDAEEDTEPKTNGEVKQLTSRTDESD
jgi:hypothetical protein